MKVNWFVLLFFVAPCFPLQGLAQGMCGFEDNGTRTAADISAIRKTAADNKVTGIVRTIPVVVSIFYSTAGASSNISDAQVASGIEVLNEGFRGQYGGIDTDIQFCLSGIKRIQNPSHAIAFIGGNELVIKSIGQEDPTRFYNVYIVEEIYGQNNSPVTGYTFTPKIMTTDSRYDGTMIQHSVWGKIGTGATDPDFNLGRIAVHEAGHWLNLFHPFGTCDYDWNCEAANDCCCDTPPMTVAKNERCKDRKNSCQTDNPDERDPIHNFMGYTPDDCRTEFTTCQSSRMNYTLDSLRPFAFFTSGDCPHWKQMASWDANTSRDFEITAYSNPAKETVTVRLNVIGKESPLNVDIYDAQGKLVTSLAREAMLAIGQHEYRFDAPSPGIYLARVASPWATKTIKLVRLAK